MLNWLTDDTFGVYLSSYGKAREEKINLHNHSLERAQTQLSLRLTLIIDGIEELTDNFLVFIY